MADGCKLDVFAVVFYEMDPHLLENYRGEKDQEFMAARNIAKNLKLVWRNPLCCATIILVKNTYISLF